MFKLEDGTRIGLGYEDPRKHILGYCKCKTENEYEYCRIRRVTNTQIIYDRVEWNGTEFIPNPVPYNKKTRNEINLRRNITLLNIIQT